MVEHAIQLKRAYEPAGEDDGCRILVDGIWPRGVSKEDLAADLWLKDLAPSKDLRQWFAHDPDKWDEFQRRYFDELDEQNEALAALRDRLAQGPVTLLFGARDEEHNQAVALKRYLQQDK